MPTTQGQMPGNGHVTTRERLLDEFTTGYAKVVPARIQFIDVFLLVPMLVVVLMADPMWVQALGLFTLVLWTLRLPKR